MTRRRILLLFTACLLVLSVGAYVVLYQTDATRTLVRSIIGETIRDDLFRLDDAEISLTAGTVTLRKFVIEHPDLGSRTSPLVSIDKIEVDVETNPLGEVLAPRNVHLEGLHVNLAQDRLPEFGDILKVAGVKTDDEKTPLPSITVANSTVLYRIAPDRPPIRATDLQLTMTPLEDNPGEFELAGSMRTELGNEVQIRGGGNTEKGQFRVLVTMEDIPIKPEQAAAYQKEAAEYLAAGGVTGNIKKATFWIDVRARAAGANGAKDGEKAPEMQLGINAELEKLSATPTDFPYALHGATGRIYGTLGRTGTVKFHFEHKAPDGGIVASGKITRIFAEGTDKGTLPLIDVQVELNQVRAGERIEKAFRGSSFATVRESYEAFAPTAGSLSAKARIHNDAPGGELGLSADITLHDLAGAFHGLTTPSGRHIGFPYPVQKVNGTIAIRPELVTLENLTGRDTAGATFSLNGQIVNVAGDLRPNMDIRAENAQFSQPLRDALKVISPEGAVYYDEFQPRGKGNLTVQLRDAGRGTKFLVDIVPTQASASYDKEFPYRVHGLDGVVKITNEGVWIDLRGSNRGAEISVDGRFLLEPEFEGKGVQSELWVKATKLPMDDELRLACKKFSADIAKLWERAEPKGFADCEFTMWSEDKEDDFSYDVHVGVGEGSALRVRDFPVPVESLRGDLFVYGTGPDFRCDISSIRGEIHNDESQAPALVLVQGSVVQKGKQTRPDITTIVRRLQLNPEVGAAADSAGICTRKMWNDLGLGGFVDVNIHTEPAKNPDDPSQPFQQRLTLRLRDVQSAWENLPGVARGLHGEITVVGETAKFALVEGVIDETKITVRDGVIEPIENGTRVQFLVDSESVPVDKRLGCFLSETAHAALLSSNISGHVGLTGFEVNFLARRGSDPEIRFGGDVTAHDLFVDVGLPGGHSLQHLNGSVNLSGRVDATGGYIRGTVKDVALVLTNQRISGLTGRFEVTPEKLTVHDAQFEVARGWVRGKGPEGLALSYVFAKSGGRLKAFLEFSQLSLNEFLRERGLGHSKVRGLVSGTVNIQEIRGANFLDMRADGEVGVNNGRLGFVPLFSALYSHIAEDKRPQFTQGYAKFSVENQKITLSRIRARSTEFKVEGEGTLNMDGYMDVQLRVPGLFGSAANVFILPTVIDWGVSKVVRFQLYGYIRDPKLSWNSDKNERTLIAPIGPAVGPSSRSSTRSDRPGPPR